MKNFKLFKLLLLGVVLITSINSAWGWSQVSLRGDMKGIGWSTGYRWTDETGSGSTETYAAYGDGFKLYIHDGVNAWVGYCTNGEYSASSLTSDGSHSHLYTNWGDNQNQNVTYIGCNGIVCFHYSNANANNNPDVWITRPTVHLKNTWNAGSWTWKSTYDEGNGYYYVDANYGADGVNWGTNGSSAWQKNSTDVYIAASTKYPSSISAGTKVRYRLNTNPSGDSWDAATPTLTIHKILTIKYYDNGKTSGTKPGDQEAPHSIASTLATNSGNMAKTGYVFTGWNTQADGKGTHYDAGASITITANTDLYAEWNRKWAVQGSGTEMGAWSKFNYLAPTGNANEFSGTIDLAANTTYVFKLRNREDNSLWGYGDNGNYQLAYIGQSSAHAHNLESTDGKKNLVLMSAKAGTYTFTYNQSTKRLTVGFPSQTHPNTNNIYFKNSGASPYTGVCINIYGGATDGISGWERMPSMPSCTIDGQTYYYSAIGDNTKCKFANAANSGTNTGEKTGIQSCKGKYYDLATNTWKSFVFDITYKDQGNVAFSGTHNDSPSAHPTTHTFGSSTSLNTASKTGYTFGGWFTNSSCTGSAVSSLTATGYTADITLYAKWTPITYTIRYYSNSASYIGTATDTTAVSSHTYDVAKNLNSNGFNLTGYAFWGWSTTTGTSSATYTDGESVTNLSSTNGATVPLYARWNIQSYTLTWNLAGGTVTTAGTGAAVDATGSPSSSVTYHASITTPEVTRAGYTFAGWDVSPASNMPAANTTYTATWTPKELTFAANNGNNWDEEDNWTDSKVPTIEHDVVLTAPVEVNIAHAVAKSVVIDTSSTNTGKLTVQANKGLEVAGTIQMKNASLALVPTNAKRLILESSEAGNATLIFNNSNADSATVYMYSKGWTEGTQGGGTWNWQYVGIPVTNATRLNDYYGGYMYEWNTSTRGWDDVKNTSATLTTFKAYSVSYPTDEGNLHTYEIDGELAATTNHTISVDAGQTVQAAANSWTAPIRIKDITYTNWTPATIFIFNTGYGEAEKATEVGQRYTAGTYLPIPVSSAPYLGEYYIAPMQGFLFKNTRGSDATITLSYADAVRTDGSGEIVAGPMHAPARYEDGIVEPVVLKIYVCGTENDDRVVLLERSDFSREFDNGWDGEKFQVNAVKTAPRIFAINATGGKEAVSAIPEFDGTVIGFRPGTDDSYKISFEYNGGDMLYLKDTKNNILTLINNESEYEFYSNGENEDARFLIYKAPAVTTGVSETGVDAIAHKQMIDGVLYIIRNGQIYSTDGQIVK